MTVLEHVIVGLSRHSRVALWRALVCAGRA